MREVFIDEWITGTIISIIMNSLLLWASGRIVRKTTSWWRILLAGFLGGIYFFSFCYRREINLINWGEVVIYIATGLVMLLISYYPISKLEYANIAKTFLILVILTSATTYFLFYLFPYYSNRPFKTWEIILINFFVFLIVTEFGWGLIHEVVWEKSCVIPIEIILGGTTLSINALLDTGNKLVEPLSKDPVIVLDIKTIQNLLPVQILEISKALVNGEIPSDFVWDFEPMWAKRIRFLSYSSVGKDKGFLLGIRPDDVEILRNEKRRSTKAFIGLYYFPENNNHLYQALLPAGLLVEAS